MKTKYIIISSLLACVLLYFIEQVVMADYLIKTLTKVLLFTLVPIIYLVITNRSQSRNYSCIKRTHKQPLKLGVLFGIISFFTILLTFYICRNFIDLDGIVKELQNKSKITPGNFALVGVYITFGNSFLEEFFFRGFIFLNLYKQNYKKTAYIYSSLLFGLYHIVIFKTWFNIYLIGLALFGLITVGFVFNWLDTKSENFINSWIVHILADSAIILIGFKMFGMI